MKIQCLPIEEIEIDPAFIIEYISDGVLSGDVLLAEDMTVKGWCVLSNLKVYAGY